MLHSVRNAHVQFEKMGHKTKCIATNWLFSSGVDVNVSCTTCRDQYLTGFIPVNWQHLNIISSP